MRNTSKLAMRWYALGLVFPPLVVALHVPLPPKTITVYEQVDPQNPQPTASFDDDFHAAVRRDTSSDASTSPMTLFTSFAPASVCGWYNNDASSSITCSYDLECAFHASNAAWPGMMGCCPSGNYDECGFASTCYDNSDLIATPSLLSTIDPLAVYCNVTDGDTAGYGSCYTLVYPQLGVSGYGCAPSKTTFSIYTDTPVTPTAADYVYITMAYLISVPDSVMPIIANGSGTGMEAGTSTSTSSLSAATTSISIATSFSPAPSSGSSTSVGTIVGGVVGGFISFVIIVVNCIFLRLWMKKRKEEEARAKNEIADRPLELPEYTTISQHRPVDPPEYTAT